MPYRAWGKCQASSSVLKVAVAVEIEFWINIPVRRCLDVEFEWTEASFSIWVHEHGLCYRPTTDKSKNRCFNGFSFNDQVKFPQLNFILLSVINKMNPAVTNLMVSLGESPFNIPPIHNFKIVELIIDRKTDLTYCNRCDANRSKDWFWLTSEYALRQNFLRRFPINLFSNLLLRIDASKFALLWS